MATQSTPPVIQRSSLRMTIEFLLKDRPSLLAACFLGFLVLFALGAPLLAMATGHPPNDQFRETGMTPTGIPVGPNANFWLGADQLGRDVIVRLAYGARVSLIVGVVASIAAAGIGILIGMIAGYFGGKVDTILSRCIDLVMSVPFLLAALALVSVLGASLPLSVAVIIFFSWTGLARVIRGQVIALRQREFIEAARSLGASHWGIIFRDILPNLAAPIIIYATLMIPASIVFEATLSFLGMGIVPPNASWGGMLAEASGNSIYLTAWWLVLFPGLALLFSTLAFNVLGDGLRDSLDPRVRGKAK